MYVCIYVHNHNYSFIKDVLNVMYWKLDSISANILKLISKAKYLFEVLYGVGFFQYAVHHSYISSAQFTILTLKKNIALRDFSVKSFPR